MKNKELIEALQKLDQDAEVIINIKQYNKAYGKQLTIGNEKTGYENNPFVWIGGTYSGATITVFLPEKAIISNWPKNTF